MNLETQSLSRKSRIREQNYQTILAAAQEVFAQFGFKGASMNAIAEIAQLPKANLHYYFKSKQSLYLVVLQTILLKWNEGLDDLSVSDDPAIALEKYIAEKCNLAFQKPLQSRLFASEIISGAPNLKDFIYTEMRPWVAEKLKVFEQWMEQGKIRTMDPMVLMFMIWSVSQHYADFQTQVLLITDKTELNADDQARIIRNVTEVILLGLGLKPSWF